jgi:hypothetical protein
MNSASQRSLAFAVLSGAGLFLSYCLVGGTMHSVREIRREPNLHQRVFDYIILGVVDSVASPRIASSRRRARSTP